MSIIRDKVVFIDFKLTKKNEAIRFKQYDTNKIKFIITDNDVAADLSEVTSVVANFRRPDKQVYSHVLTPDGNEVTLQLENIEMEIVGKAELVLQFYFGEERLSTSKVLVYIDDNIEVGGTPTHEEISVITELIESVNERLTELVDYDNQLSIVQNGLAGKASAEEFSGFKGVVATQLAQSVDINRQNGISKANDIKATLVFIDDDMRVESYQNVYQEFVVGRNIPFAFAAISSFVGTNANYMTQSQFDEIKNDKRCAIVNHTNTHPRLADLNEEEIEEEIRLCDEFLRKNGIYSRVLVPPFGSSGVTVRKVAKKYIDNILITTLMSNATKVNCQNGDFLDSTYVRRVDFSNTLEDLKSCVDEAIAKNGFLIISTHGHYSQDPSATLNFVPQKLHDLLDYCQSTTIEITDIYTGLNRFKNALEFYDNDELKIAISAAGKTKGITNVVVATAPKSSTTAPTESNYEKGKVTKRTYLIAEATTYGYPFGGTLEQHRGETDTYTFEILYAVRTSRFAYRSWQYQTQEWTEWLIVEPSKDRRVNVLFTGTNYANIASMTHGRYVLSASASSGVVVGDIIAATPVTNVPAGIMYNASVNTDGHVVLDIFNATSSVFNVGGTTWKYIIVR